MKFKSLFYITISTLLIAIIGTTLRYFAGFEHGKSITMYAMSFTQIAGLLLILLNGSILYQTQKIIHLGVGALLFLLGNFIRVIVPAQITPAISLALQITGIAYILWIYTKWFLAKAEHESLDVIKILWLVAVLITALMGIFQFNARTYVAQFANVLFYTMLIFFIWLSSSHSAVQKKLETPQES
jgi:hypothetical protein